MSAAAVPRIIIELPIEGAARARLDCSTFEEECRLAGELADRALLAEIVDALLVLAAELEAAA